MYNLTKRKKQLVKIKLKNFHFKLRLKYKKFCFLYFKRLLKVKKGLARLL